MSLYNKGEGVGIRRQCNFPADECRNEINATLYMLPENHTDKIQPIHAGCGQMMKLKIAAATDSWLEKEDNLDKNN